MILKTVTPQEKTIKEFRNRCKLFVDGKASIDYLLDSVIKMRLIKERK